ncbi:MAG: hypothetical protein AAFV53_00790 [Myxococcota bacterium]
MNTTPTMMTKFGSEIERIEKDLRSDGASDVLRARLRDVCLQARDGLRDTDADRLRALVATVDFPPIGTIAGMPISDCPTMRFCALRFLDEADVPEALRPRLAATPTPEVDLRAVYVDPETLHFRNFENILPLDRLFNGIDTRCAAIQIEARLGDRALHRFQLTCSDALQERLLGLDTLGLYVPPLNHISRGGQRLVFHSAALADALRGAVLSALPDDQRAGFSHINPVFRCNRFSPDDAPFRPHLDAPYRDPARSHVSRYTLLLYLTGGAGDSTLEVDGHRFSRLEAMTGILFDQRYRHQGAPYAQGDKVFVRTELIFKDDDAVIQQDRRISELFSRACYVNVAGRGDAALSRYSDECYDRVARAHWSGMSEDDQATAYLHRVFNGLHFLTSGTDLWFREADISPRQAAALAVLDFFNARVGGESFHQRCRLAQIRWGTDTSWIPGYLEDVATTPAEPMFAPLDIAWLLPPPEESPSDLPADPGAFWDPDVMERPPPDADQQLHALLSEEHAHVRKHLEHAPIFILGQELFFDPSQFIIDGDKIHVLSNQRLAPINFANFWQPYVHAEVSVEPLHPLVPPILFSRRAGCLHLTLCFFQNDWSVGMEPTGAQTIPSL